MNKKNIAIGIGSVAFGAFFFISAFSIKQSASSSASASLFPKVISGLMMLMGLLLLLREYMDARKGKSDSSPIELRNGKVVLTFCGAMILYAFMLNVLGFIICTFAYLTSMVILLNKERSRRNIIISVVFGVVFTALLYVMFDQFFNATLPVGIVFGG